MKIHIFANFMLYLLLLRSTFGILLLHYWFKRLMFQQKCLRKTSDQQQEHQNYNSIWNTFNRFDQHNVCIFTRLFIVFFLLFCIWHVYILNYISRRIVAFLRLRHGHYAYVANHVFRSMSIRPECDLGSIFFFFHRFSMRKSFSEKFVLLFVCRCDKFVQSVFNSIDSVNVLFSFNLITFPNDWMPGWLSDWVILFVQHSIFFITAPQYKGQ